MQHGAQRVRCYAQVFNSRTCQLVLGAGAMQVAGLKSITAKHLALSCQCLGALIALHAPLLAALGAPLPVSRRALLVPELRLVLQVGHSSHPKNSHLLHAHTRNTMQLTNHDIGHKPVLWLFS